MPHLEAHAVQTEKRYWQRIYKSGLLAGHQPMREQQEFYLMNKSADFIDCGKARYKARIHKKAASR